MDTAALMTTDDREIVRLRRRLPPGAKPPKLKRSETKQAGRRGRPAETDEEKIASMKNLKGFKISSESIRAMDILRPRLKDVADVARSHYMTKSNPPRSRNTRGEAPASLVVEVAVLYLLSRMDAAKDPDKFMRHVYRVADRQFIAAEITEEVGGPEV